MITDNSKRTILLLISIVLTLSSVVSARDLQRHVVKVGDFTQLSVVDAVNVDYKSHPDSAGMAVFSAPAKLVSAVVFSNNGKGKLTIQLDTKSIDDDTQLPTVTVYSRFLTNIENLADSTVRAYKVNAGPNFRAKLEGNGRLSLRDIDIDKVAAKVFTGHGQLAIDGRCREANLSCTGTGAIQAHQLKSENTIATIIGPCNIGCNVTGLLTVKGTGPGSIYYTGNPVKIKNYGISVKLKPL